MASKANESTLDALVADCKTPQDVAALTDVVLDEVRAWQERPLEAIYPILWLDGLVLKIRHGKQVTNRCAHVVLGLNLRGEKEVLGVWISDNEGAKFWAAVLSELKQRGVKDIFIACMDGLKGLPEAVTALFPKTLTQQCIVHLVRASMRYVAAKDMKAVAASLRRIYTSVTMEDAAHELDAFEEEWGEKYRAAVRVWRNAWPNVVPFFQFPPEIRKITYTTNAIESLNMTMRKYTRTYTPYQVLGESTHKYSSTHVSGGGGSIHGNQWGVHGYTAPVASTVAYHSEQGVWARDLATKGEVKLNFGTGNNIEVREGHRIVVVNDHKGKRLRTFVADTGYSFGADRLYNPWMLTSKEFLGWSLPFALVAMIPYVGPVLLAAMFLARAVMGRFDRSDTKSSMVSMVMLGALAVELLVVIPT